MHVLVLPSWFQNIKHPTLGSFFKDQALALAHEGHKVGLIHPIAISLKSIKYWRPKKAFKEKNITIFSNSYLNLPKFRKFNIYRRIQQFEKLYLSYIIEHGKPDILHAHSCALGPFGFAGVAAEYISSKYDIPFVITEHASAFHYGYVESYDIPMIKKAFQYANKVIAVSHGLATDLKKFGIQRPIEVIGNIVDIDLFKPSTSNFSQSNNIYTFITVAYLRPIKQIHLIVEAFSRAFKEKQNIRLIIIGNGEQKIELISLVKTLGISGYVDFLGEISRKEIAKQMHAADCYILTSEYETFSVASHEALASGLSLISTPCGGPENTIIKLSEVLLEDNKINSLVKAMLNESDNRKTQIDINKNYHYINQNFSSSAIGKKLNAILIEIISDTKIRKGLCKIDE